MKPLLSPLLLLAALSPTSSALALNLLKNASFESPSIGSNPQEFAQGSTIGNGWVVGATTSSSVVIHTGYTGGGVTWPEPTDGTQFLYMANSAQSSTIYQDVTLSPGSYKLTLDLANFLGGGYAAGAKINGALSLASGGSIANDVFTRPLGAGFATFEWTFAVNTSDTYRLSFENPNGYGSNLDNVTLTAVPEPSEWTCLTALACTATAWAQRKSRKWASLH